MHLRFMTLNLVQYIPLKFMHSSVTYMGNRLIIFSVECLVYCLMGSELMFLNVAYLRDHPLREIVVSFFLSIMPLKIEKNLIVAIDVL